MTFKLRKSAEVLAVLATGMLLAASATTAHALVTKLETKCAKKLAKGAIKLNSTIAKETGKCRDADISGKATGSCPNTKNSAKINAAAQKLADAAAKSCGSVCSVSPEVSCLTDALCPPLGNLTPPAPEKCSAGAKNKPFDMGNIGFPGPFCEFVLGGPIVSTDDLAQCVSTRTTQASENLVDVIYGSITSASAVSKTVAKCLASMSKATQKLVSTTFKGVAKCRDSINKGKTTANPATCTTDDLKLAAKITKAENKLRDAITKKCSDADISELDICGAGPGATTTVADAQSCLIAAAHEIVDTTETPVLRSFSSVSLVEAPYPPEAVCGDNVVNQIANPFLLLGEECDGTDDSACPGQCFPVGDVFECTCGNIPRVRFVANGLTADLDSGWRGTSHNQGVADGAGYILTRENCDCDAFDPNNPLTCIGTSADSVCDGSGFQLPVCSFDPTSSLRCDQVGNLNNKDEDKDCYICDAFSVNAGSFCRNEGDCQAQCFNGSTPTGPCTDQKDCPAGQVCHGQCDRRPTCIITPNGAPLPISSGGTAVCVLSLFREDVTGTQNIVTGEHENFIRQFSVVHLGVSNEVPCPVCGGFCVGGNRPGAICEGTCSTTASTSCRFDSDCPSGESCTTAAFENKCPGGGTCNLSLVCFEGRNKDQPCRVEAATTMFGTTSNDCLPDLGKNISNEGLEINFLPSTSEPVSMPATMPCTSPGFELFDCPCPDDAGVPTRPTLCTPACDAGAELGVGCADGNTSGIFTTCAGGSNDGRACDEDTDCPGSTCSNNPTHCTGDPAFDRFLCSSNADCGSGTCADACPSGRCVPLCVPLLSDPEEGVCAAGPSTFHCSGEGHTFRVCTKVEEGTQQFCEAGTDGVLGTNDDIPGAGTCIADVSNCFLNPIESEGGDTLNGKGDPTNVRTGTVFCIGATSNSTINGTAGLGGPGRLRQDGVNVPNFTSLP